MIDLHIKVGIPFLWGDKVFEKERWGAVNILVGPNGTGKTVFARELIHLLPAANPGLKPRFISSDRLAGRERQGDAESADSLMLEGIRYEDYERWREQGLAFGLSSAALVILKEKLDIRLRIEASLSQLFRRRLELVEHNGGFSPRLSRIAGGYEYGLEQDECHGLKELITLLTFLYDDEFNCLIIDEPELHLHPQFQNFMMQEIRSLAGNPLEHPGRKTFFLVTHSPYFVDVRTVRDLQHCLVFRPDSPPSFVGELTAEDYQILKRFLPRLNTHHKQFFFSVRPVFVEGYTDQQIFSLIQERRGHLLGAAGECFIDVGGKDELDLFYRLCRRLGIEAQAITDLDALFGGRFLRTLSSEESLRDLFGGSGEDFLAPVKQRMTFLAREMSRVKHLRAVGGVIREYVAYLRSRSEEEARIYAFYLGLVHFPAEVERLLPQRRTELESLRADMARAGSVLTTLGVHVLSRGQLEHYLPSAGPAMTYHFADSAKRGIFERERDFILTRHPDPEQIAARYGELVQILDRATRYMDIDISSFLSDYLVDFTRRVVRAAESGTVVDRDTLLAWPELDYEHFSRLMSLESFERQEDGNFRCRVRLESRVDPTRRELEFDCSTEPDRLSEQLDLGAKT